MFESKTTGELFVIEQLFS